MAKANNKTITNKGNVDSFISDIKDHQRRSDAILIYEMINQMLEVIPQMWGSSIVGYGNYHCKYESGREGDFFKVGFSPRKQNLTIYVMPGFERFNSIMAKLGKYKTGKSCLYIKNMEDINIEVLKDLIQSSWNYMTEKYG